MYKINFNIVGENNHFYKHAQFENLELHVFIINIVFVKSRLFKVGFE